MTIERNRNKKIIYLNQTEYIDTMLDRFKLKDVAPAMKLYAFETDKSTDKIDQTEIEQKLGSLQYLASRPDIVYILYIYIYVYINRLSRNKRSKHSFKKSRK